MTETHSVFQRSATPRHGWELWRWVIFEPTQLRKFSDRLNHQQTLYWLAKALPSYLGILLLFYAAMLILRLGLVIWIVQADLPTHYPTQFQPEIQTFWQTASDATMLQKIQFLFFYDLALGLAVGLAGSLAFGLALDLALGLAVGSAGGLAGSLALGLVLGLAVGLAFGLALGLALGLVLGLALGLAFGLAFGLAVGLAVGLAFGLAGGLAFGLAEGLAEGLATGLGFSIAFISIFYLLYFRLPFHPVHLFNSLRHFQLTHNPYLTDGVIWLPLWGLRAKLIQQAHSHPQLAQQFIAFLLEHRPLQRNLAAHLTHATTADRWQHTPMQADSLAAPATIETASNTLQPSEAWLAALTRLRQHLLDYEQQHNIGIRLHLFQTFQQQLADFLQLTQSQSPHWHHYYLDTLRDWQTAAEHQRQDLLRQQQHLEPITPNRYLAGTPLLPNRNDGVFIGRTDLRDQLSTQLLTAQELPLLLIRGQRRVGKTSLLNFLPTMLSSRFVLIKRDLQDAAFSSIPAWLTDLRQQFNQHLNLSEPQTWQAPDDWLNGWAQLQHHFLQHSQHQQAKLIFALDEYEALHDLLQAEPKQGKRLLAAIRSFLQAQNRIVFLLVGAAFLDELQDPYWGDYFVHIQTLEVNYLTPTAARQLITEPVKLDYPESVVNDLIHLTQGHPHLLQALCSTLVGYANRDNRRKMTTQDLNNAVELMLTTDSTVQSLFWNQFCRDPVCKQTVRDLVAGHPPSDRAHFLRLKRHGYLVEMDGKWTLRVPLFRQWVQLQEV